MQQEQGSKQQHAVLFGRRAAFAERRLVLEAEERRRGAEAQQRLQDAKASALRRLTAPSAQQWRVPAAAANRQPPAAPPPHSVPLAGATGAADTTDIFPSSSPYSSNATTKMRDEHKQQRQRQLEQQPGNWRTLTTTVVPAAAAAAPANAPPQTWHPPPTTVDGDEDEEDGDGYGDGDEGCHKGGGSVGFRRDDDIRIGREAAAAAAAVASASTHNDHSLVPQERLFVAHSDRDDDFHGGCHGCGCGSPGRSTAEASTAARRRGEVVAAPLSDSDLKEMFSPNKDKRKNAASPRRGGGGRGGGGFGQKRDGQAAAAEAAVTLHAAAASPSSSSSSSRARGGIIDVDIRDGGFSSSRHPNTTRPARGVGGGAAGGTGGGSGASGGGGGGAVSSPSSPSASVARARHQERRRLRFEESHFQRNHLASVAADAPTTPALALGGRMVAAPKTTATATATRGQTPRSARGPGGGCHAIGAAGSGVSNRQNVKNALVAVCLAGRPNDARRQETVAALEAHPATHFAILLVEGQTLAYRGLYAHHTPTSLNCCGGGGGGGSSSYLERVAGRGCPPTLSVGTLSTVGGAGATPRDNQGSDFCSGGGGGGSCGGAGVAAACVIDKAYKYSSARKAFEPMHGLSTLTSTTDAVSVTPMKLKKIMGSSPRA